MWVNFIMSRLGEFNLTAALDTSDTTCVQVSEPIIKPQAQPRAEKSKENMKETSRKPSLHKKNKRSERKSRSLSALQLSVVVAHFLQLIQFITQFIHPRARFKSYLM